MNKNLKQIKAYIEEKDGDMIAVASTEDKDRVGDELNMSNWNLKNYKENPVLQAGHSHQPQHNIGIAKNIRIEKDKLVFEPEFHEITELSQNLKEMYEEETLRAWSVGFAPDEESEENELLEISSVAVPANAKALTEVQKSMAVANDEVEEESLGQIKKWVKQTLEEETKNRKDDTGVYEPEADPEREIHMLHFDKEVFDETEEVVSWLKDNDYETHKEIEETNQEFRTIHRPEKDFEDGTLEKREVSEYVDVTLGLLEKSLEESEEKARPEDLEEGDLVSWDSSGGTAYGMIDTKATSGNVEAEPEGPEMEASEENPAFKITVHEFNDDEEEWQPTDTKVVHRAETLSKIESLPEERSIQNRIYEKQRENARDADEINFDGTETAEEQPWGDVGLDFEDFADSYAEGSPEQVGDLTDQEKSMIASRTILGSADAENFEELVSFPVVNPSTDNLNEGGLNAAKQRAGQVGGETEDDIKSAADNLMSESFDEEMSSGEEEEKQMGSEEESFVNLIASFYSGKTPDEVMSMFEDDEFEFNTESLASFVAEVTDSEEQEAMDMMEELQQEEDGAHGNSDDEEEEDNKNKELKEKEGRTLSQKNRATIKGAMNNIENAFDTLEKLLSESEPDSGSSRRGAHRDERGSRRAPKQEKESGEKGRSSGELSSDQIAEETLKEIARGTSYALHVINKEDQNE